MAAGLFVVVAEQKPVGFAYLPGNGQAQAHAAGRAVGAGAEAYEELVGGQVRVALTPELLTVENTGRPRALPADQLFVRFRPGPDRPAGSVGLGLAIARQICETYGFLLSYHYEEPGRHQMRVRM